MCLMGVGSSWDARTVAGATPSSTSQTTVIGATRVSCAMCICALIPASSGIIKGQTRAIE